jgi:hypothetical protein
LIDLHESDVLVSEAADMIVSTDDIDIIGPLSQLWHWGQRAQPDVLDMAILVAQQSTGITEFADEIDQLALRYGRVGHGYACGHLLDLSLLIRECQP